MSNPLLTNEQIIELLQKLEHELSLKGVYGEICIYGGAVMCLVYKARPATKDVDAIFEPTSILRESIKKVADSNNLKEDWLNDSLKGFLVKHEKKILFSWKYLKVYIPEPDYLLAMKCLASRVDTSDKEDILFLIKYLNLKTPETIFEIIEKYYPKNQIKPATEFFIEEIFENDLN